MKLKEKEKIELKDAILAYVNSVRQFRLHDVDNYLKSKMITLDLQDISTLVKESMAADHIMEINHWLAITEEGKKFYSLGGYAFEHTLNEKKKEAAEKQKQDDIDLDRELKKQSLNSIKHQKTINWITIILSSMALIVSLIAILTNN